MIWDSRFWKDDILRRAAALLKRRRQTRWSDSSLAKVEQDVMLAAYSIRKLIEADKLSEATVSGFVAAKAFRSRGDAVTRMNWHHIERLYDLSSSIPMKLPVRDFCNQVIHSYVFVPVAGSAGLEGVMVTSDRDRDSHIIEVALDELIRVFCAVGQDYPTEARYPQIRTDRGAERGGT